MPTNIRDPRSIITPDAFGIDERLLGLPLSRPGRRLWAMLVDLLVIGLLTVFLDSIQLFIWGVVALFFIRMAFQKRGPANQAAAVLMRVFAGCLGLIILSAVVIAFVVFRSSSSSPPSTPRVTTPGVAGLEGLDALGGLRSIEDLQETESGDAVSGGAADDADSPADAAGPTEAADDAEAVAAAEAAVEAMSDGEVLAAYAALLAVEEPAGGVGQRARAGALRRRAVEVVAADTLGRLEAGLDALAEERDGLERDVRRTRRELEAERSSFAALLRDIWDQAGSAIGLWSIYFTVLLTLWKGQTVGKRLMGIRVLRLDGQPMTWWTSFERGGGYVAGIATGLLGFAQLFWDPNRQCIHDKIVGTVVVTSGGEAVPGAWRDAHGAPGRKPEAEPDVESEARSEPMGDR